MKISGNSNNVRFFFNVISLLPFVFIIIMNIIVGKSSQLYSFGYLLFFLFYLIFLTVNIYLTFLDWDVYIQNKKIILKNILGKKLIIENVSSVKVVSMPLLSIGLFLFKLNVNNESYIFKYKVKQEFTIQLLNKNYITSSIEELIRNNIDNGTIK